MLIIGGVGIERVSKSESSSSVTVSVFSCRMGNLCPIAASSAGINSSLRKGAVKSVPISGRSFSLPDFSSETFRAMLESSCSVVLMMSSSPAYAW